MAETSSQLQEQVTVTQKLLSDLISKPRITTQLLMKPPVKFIRDVFIEVSLATGCGQGLYTAAEVECMAKSRETKFYFLTLLLHFVAKAVSDAGLLSTVRINKVVAGLEPENTNLLLQKLHEAATSEACRARWPDAIEVARACAHQMVAADREATEEAADGPRYSSPTPALMAAYAGLCLGGDSDHSAVDPATQEDWVKLLLAEGFGGLEDGRLGRLANSVARLHGSIRELMEVAVDNGHLQNMSEAEFSQVILRSVWPSGTQSTARPETERSVRSEPEAEISPDGPVRRPSGATKLPPVQPSTPSSSSTAGRKSFSRGSITVIDGIPTPSGDAVVMSKRQYVRHSILNSMQKDDHHRTLDSMPDIAGHRRPSRHATDPHHHAGTHRGSREELDASLLHGHELVRLTHEKNGPELIEAVEKACQDGLILLTEPVDLIANALPIQYAAAFMKSPGLVKVLIEARADARVTFQGKEVWHGLHPGMTVLEFACTQRKAQAAKGNCGQRWQAIEEVVKAEIDRIRGWQIGRRNTRQFTTTKTKLLEIEAEQPPPISESSEESDTEVTFEKSKRSKKTSEEKPEVMRSLYTSTAGFLSEHFECHPSEVFDMRTKVGEGTFGSVWLSVNKQTGIERAIKQLPKMLLEDLSLWTEIAIMRQLDHPHIMKLFSTFEDNYNVYIVSELCSGGQLFDAIVEAGSVTERNAAQMMKQIFQAVTYLHKRFICHRDLKPENFMLAVKCKLEDVHVKLIDFGTAKRFDLQEMTTKVCTVHYVAPDLLKNQPVPYTEKCDVWSCGVILYVMLSGAPPFYGDTDMDVLKKVKKGKFFFRPKELWDYISQDACSLIQKCLTIKATERVSAEAACHDPWVEKLAPNAMEVNLANDKILGKMRNFSCYNKLKKVALQVIALQLSDEAIEHLRSLFVALDTECVGALTVAQMENAVNIIQCDEDMKLDLIYMIHEMAADTGEINYTQFIAANIGRSEYLRDEACKAAFTLCDVDGDGEISLSDLQLLFSSAHAAGDNNTQPDETDEFGQSAIDLLGVEKAEIERIMRETDTDGNGKISYSEFKEMMASKILMHHTGNSDQEVGNAGTVAGLSNRRRNSLLAGGAPAPHHHTQRSSMVKTPSMQADAKRVQDEERNEEERREAAKPKVVATIKKSATQILAQKQSSKPLDSSGTPKANRQNSKVDSSENLVKGKAGRKFSYEFGATQSMPSVQSRVSVTSEAPRKMVKSATVIFGSKGNKGNTGTDACLQQLDAEEGGSRTNTRNSLLDIAGPNPLWDELKASLKEEKIVSDSINMARLRELLQADTRCVHCALSKDEGVPPPLFFAVMLRVPELVQLFIEFRADVGQRHEGPSSWRGVRPGQTPIEANEGQIQQYMGTVQYDTCEAIQSLMKAEEDRIRCWRGGKRASQAAHRYFRCGTKEEGCMSANDVEKDAAQAVEDAGPNSVEDAAAAAACSAMSKKTLYESEATFVCQHISGNPADVFRIDKQVGEGTFGVVSRTLEKATGLERAMKTVPKELLEESDLWQEIELMRGFDHPLVARLYGTYEDGKNLYMIMEHCSGGELFEAVENAGSLPEMTSATIFQQMLIAVSYIHSKQVCHRDLKPENFLLSRPGPVERALVKLIDFGTARYFSTDNPMTTKICTIHYVAPEILVRGDASYTEKCDMWSLGVCLYLMVCGAPPFYGDSDAVTLKQVRKGKFKFEPESLWDHMEQDIKIIISALLQMNPCDRLSAQQALTHPWLAKRARRLSTILTADQVIPRLAAFHRLSWFKQKALQMVAKQLSESDVNDIRPIWFCLDSSSRGKFNHHDLARVTSVEGLGETLSEQRTQLLLRMEADAVEVGYTSFLAAMLDLDRRTHLAACKSAFKEFDLDDDDLIRMVELNIIWQCVGADLTRSKPLEAQQLDEAATEACRGVLQLYDRDGDGALAFAEFMMMMREEEFSKEVVQN